MEGKYTKISAAVAVIALAITGWQLFPKHKKNFSGIWNMTSVIKSASLQSYVNSEAGWKLTVTQSENNMTGSAEKISVNSVQLAYKDRTSLTLEGTVSNNHFILHFTEKGRLRETRGIFEGDFDGDRFTGTFSSTASDTQGIITGEKQN